MTRLFMYAGVLVFTVMVGFFAGVNHELFKQLKTQQKITFERDKLQVKLNAKDIQIQQLQTDAATRQDNVIYKKEVVYRDKVKYVGVRQCIADSGLLELYDATVSTSGK